MATIVQVKSFSDALNRIKEIRERKLRQSREVVELWSSYLGRYQNSLGDDKWLILELVFVSSLDVGDFSLAKKILGILGSKFSQSMRVRRLDGMLHEAGGEFDQAEDIYKEILEQDPVDAATQKRLVALHKSQGKITDAVQALNRYLEVNAMDHEGWMELSELYLSQLDYEKAAFCVEELILINPHNHLFHQKYADIKYSQGEFDLARVYYSQASKLSPASVRALYGVTLCSQKLAAQKKDKCANISMARKAIEDLNKKFKELNSPTSEINRKALDCIINSIS